MKKILAIILIILSLFAGLFIGFNAKTGKVVEDTFMYQVLYGPPMVTQQILYGCPKSKKVKKPFTRRIFSKKF